MKHNPYRPEASLPWKVDNEYTGSNCGLIKAWSAHNHLVFDEVSYKDAEYIVHAANAYPKLIAKLHEIRQITGTDMCGNLLRELGEE